MDLHRFLSIRYGAALVIVAALAACANDVTPLEATGDYLPIKGGTLDGGLTVQRDLVVEGNVDVAMNASVDGNVSVGASLSVDGTSTLTGDVSAAGDVRVTGEASASTFRLGGGAALSPSVGPGVDDIGLYAGSAERLTISNNGNVGIGTSRPDEKLHVLSGDVLIQGAGYSVVLERNSDDSGAHSLVFQKSHGNAEARTPARDADLLGTLSWLGYDGVGYVTGAAIAAFVEQPTGVADMPTNLRFLTTPDGEATARERMRISRDGSVGIGTPAPSATLDVAGGIKSTIGLANGYVIAQARESSVAG